MDKVDFKKTDKAFYSGKVGRWDRITVPALPYIAVTGQGAPEGPDYAAAMAALYPVAYGVKFASKAQGQDFVVPPQSTQWWADDPSAFAAGRRDEWQWQAMIRMPDWVDETMVEAAKSTKDIEGVALVKISEGDCFQTLHVGPYSEEGPVLADLHERFMVEAGVTFGGPHHEIYLSDPRKVALEKLRTILRQPVVDLET